MFMNRFQGNHRTVVVLILLLVCVPALARADAEILDWGANGAPTFVAGDLGTIDAVAGLQAKGLDQELFRLSARNALLGALVEHFGARGGEDVEVLRVREDEIGKVHVRFQQHLNGLPVVGAQMYLHADAATGGVYAVNGEFAPDVEVPAPALAEGDAAGVGIRLAELGVAGDVFGEPELLYFHDAESGRTHLSWKVRVRGVEDGTPFDDEVYLDARSFEIVALDGHVKTARRRRTHDATGSEVTDDGITGLPGDLKCDERDTRCGDASAQRAHAGAAVVYDYYRSKFGRDSLDDRGMILSSSVHVGQDLANAFWYAGSQMLYGDGDGMIFRDLTRSFEVIAHEFTHGVTDFESDLIYQKQSGALNEALSDIFAAAADSFRRGGAVDAATWRLGEAVFTPRIPGDAMRYMNDPERDGYSRSYYPERLFRGACRPSGDNDRCGVHGNSGIANLAFYLMVEGGRHPRGKTSVRVPAIGMARAERIFYRAQTSCLTSGATFRSARNCTAQAAQELYGSAIRNKVHKAWDAVGVPNASGGGGGGGGGNELVNGVARTGLAGPTASRRYFFIRVPEGATGLTFRLAGGSGDPDLYVRRGSRPSTATYECRSWRFGTSELCRFASPQPGNYHVLIHGFTSYSGVRLVASFDEPAP